MSGNAIREKFLEFFESKGHAARAVVVIGAAWGIRRCCLTNAGMNQFKDVFLGLENGSIRVRRRRRNACGRAGSHDLENVGLRSGIIRFLDAGEFSFGDYFKKDAVAFAWS